MTWFQEEELTTVRLLFIGWKVQQSNSLDSGSLTSRMHRPSSVFQIRSVPSSDVDTMMSLLRDQAKSVTGPPWPFRVSFTLGGGGDSAMMDRVPSNEQQARSCLSSFANCNRGTSIKQEKNKKNPSENDVCMNDLACLEVDLRTSRVNVLVKYVVHPSKGVVFTQGCVTCHGTACLCHRGGHQAARGPGAKPCKTLKMVYKRYYRHYIWKKIKRVHFCR